MPAEQGITLELNCKYFRVLKTNELFSIYIKTLPNIYFH